MPVDYPGRLVAIYITAPRWGNEIRGFSYPDLLDYRKQDTGLSHLMGSTGVSLNFTGGERPELIWGEIVTGNFFSRGGNLRAAYGANNVCNQLLTAHDHGICTSN